MKALHLDQETIRKIYDLEDQDAKLPLSDAIFCAEDERRNRVFEQAIRQAVIDLKKKCSQVVVVDAGSGTGILGLFALRSGADKCYFLEQNPYALAFSKKVIQKYGFEAQSVFLEGDATEVDLPETFDLLISETLTAGFVAEDFPKIINHLRIFRQPHSIFIPEAFSVSVTEKDGQYQTLAEHQFYFRSQAGFQKNKLLLVSPTKTIAHLVWRSEAFLYQQKTLQSGDCLSFLNQRKTRPQDFHPLFEIQS
jgi:16S rRNA G966 N2-methylase RsmD